MTRCLPSSPLHCKLSLLLTAVLETSNGFSQKQKCSQYLQDFEEFCWAKHNFSASAHMCNCLTHLVLWCDWCLLWLWLLWEAPLLSSPLSVAAFAGLASLLAAQPHILHLPNVRGLLWWCAEMPPALWGFTPETETCRILPATVKTRLNYAKPNTPTSQNHFLF